MAAPVITGVVVPATCTVGIPFNVIVAAITGNPAAFVDLTATATAVSGETSSQVVSVQVLDPINDAVTVTLTAPDAPNVSFTAGANPGEFTVLVN